MISICPVNRIHEILPIGLKFFAYAKELGEPSPISFMNFWNNQYEAKNGCLLIEETDNEIKGFYGLIFSTEPWTGVMTATEVCWYSEGSGGVRMLKMAEDIAKKCGAKVFYAHHLNNPEHEKLNKFYVKSGFNLAYYRYTKEL